jgi:flagellar export protein FliJ
MKAFHFPLDQVRRWRHEQAELEELKLQKIYIELRSLKALAAQVQSEYDRASQTVLGAAQAEAHELANLDSFRDFTRTKLKKIDAQIQDCQKRADAQRLRLIEFRRQFELLEKLKKKNFEEWRLGRDKEQEELAAELFLAKRSRDRD